MNFIHIIKILLTRCFYYF